MIAQREHCSSSKSCVWLEITVTLIGMSGEDRSTLHDISAIFSHCAIYLNIMDYFFLFFQFGQCYTSWFPQYGRHLEFFPRIFLKRSSSAIRHYQTTCYL